METIEHESTQAFLEEAPVLFVVWIDTNCGWQAPDWEMNSAPQPLGSALDEARDARAAGFPAKILPEGQTPRADGLFSNPLTEP